MNNELTNPEYQLPILPDDLILEQILPRLPVKSLIRFKSVSKHWLFTISSHEFHMKHLKFSSINRNQSLILRKWQWFHGEDFHVTYPAYVAYYFALDKCFNSQEFVELEFKFPSPNLPRGLGYVDLVDSCNGLVCFWEYDNSFFLWNPATNQCRNVSHPDIGVSDLIAEVTCFGFAYVSSIDDYIIACLMTFEEYVCHYFFSMRAGRWITMDKLDELIFHLCYPFGYAIDDTMYWPPEDDVTIGSDIVAVNLVGGQLRKIPLMNFGIDYFHCRVSEINGCLSLYCMYPMDTHYELDVCDVWMLKQLDNLDSWEKMFSIRDGFSKLLYIYETGECLVTRGERVLMLYSPSQVAPKEYEEGNVIWHTSEQGNLYNNIHVRGYAESLISPFPTAGYEDDNETEE